MFRSKVQVILLGLAVSLACAPRKEAKEEPPRGKSNQDRSKYGRGGSGAC